MSDHRPRQRLLSINTYHYRRAGSDAMFLDHDRLARTKGWDTAVFSMSHPENLPSPWASHFVDEVEYGRVTGFWGKLQAAGKAIYSFEARRKMHHLLDTFRPDIVHVHSLYHHISPSVLSLIAARRIPIVLTAHDYKLLCPVGTMYRAGRPCEGCRGWRLDRLIGGRCSHDALAESAVIAAEAGLHRWLSSYAANVARVICPSRFMQRKFIEWGWSPERLAYIPNFFDPDLWQPDAMPGSYFLYFGRLVPKKGVETLIRAAALAQVPLKVIGWGPDEERLIGLAAEAGVHAKFLPRLEPEALAPMIRGARAVVVPSQWYENASLSILEAHACGKPVIASSIGGNPELVEPGATGWLFEAGDVQGLARMLVDVSTMPDAVVTEAGLRARKHVEAKHNPNLYFNRVSALYASLAQQSTRACQSA